MFITLGMLGALCMTFFASRALRDGQEVACPLQGERHGMRTSVALLRHWRLPRVAATVTVMTAGVRVAE